MTNSTSHWLYLHDGKPGHLNQLRGFAHAITKLHPHASSSWFDVSRLTMYQRFSGRCAELQTLPKADVIIATGHSTHWLVLLLRKKWKSHTVIVMRPSWPTSWFDSVIMPKHDIKGDKVRSNVYLTEGAMNMVGSQKYLPRNKGLVLLGGNSKHFEWPDEQITQQVSAIIESHPELEWTVTDSRRSPSKQIADIQLACPAATYQDYRNCPKDWLLEKISQSDTIWITPDSVSMVYEALSSGARVGLIELPPKAQNRINRGMLTLITEGKVSAINLEAEITIARTPLPRLNEAKNAAQWLTYRL